MLSTGIVMDVTLPVARYIGSTGMVGVLGAAGTLIAMLMWVCCSAPGSRRSRLVVAAGRRRSFPT